MDAAAERTVINSSRQIIYASKGADFAQTARQAALSLRDEINHCLTDR
jgi:orotidine-5'-phosphate decarboxylase